MSVAPVEAVVVVDLQRAAVHGSHEVPDHLRVVDAARLLVSRARDAGALVVHVQNDGPRASADERGTEGWRLVLEVLEDDEVVSKREDDAFTAGLDDVLRRRGVRSLAICGVQSEMCVAATTRGALARGLRVVLPHDAHATRDVPPLDGAPGPGVDAASVARVAEWSLGGGVELVLRAADVRFDPTPG